MKKHLLVTITSFCITLSLSGQIPTNGLVSKWRFDGNASQITFDSHSNYSLNNTGAAPTQGHQGANNTGAFFDGNDIMSVNNAVFRPTTFSMATWFYKSGTTPYNTLACVRLNTSTAPFNSYNISVGSSTSNYLKFFFSTATSNDVALADTSITQDLAWTHVAVTCSYNGTTTTAKMFVNGLLHSQTTAIGSIIYGTSPALTLGNVNGLPPNNALIGGLDEFLFYNRELAAQEVNNIYNTSFTTVGLDSHNKFHNSKINIYPNPTSSILNIEVKETTQIFITNLLGEVVKTENIYGSSQIDVSDLNAGVYFIQDIKSGKAVKFIKK